MMLIHPDHSHQQRLEVSNWTWFLEFDMSSLTSSSKNRSSQAPSLKDVLSLSKIFVVLRNENVIISTTHSVFILRMALLDIMASVTAFLNCLKHKRQIIEQNYQSMPLKTLKYPNFANPIHANNNFEDCKTAVKVSHKEVTSSSISMVTSKGTDHEFVKNLAK